MCVRIAVSALMATAIVIQLAPAIAQIQPSDEAKRRGPNRRAAPDPEAKTERLLAPAPIPNVPAYTGRMKFVSGLRYPNDPTGIRTGMTFLVQEDMDQVRDWYKQALQSYQWMIIPLALQPNMISATSAQGRLLIQLKSTRSPGYRTEVSISFQAR